MLYLGADHRGFALKESLKRHLSQRGVAFEDYGASDLTPDDDYVDYGLAVARAVSLDPAVHRGVLLCGSGVGMAVVGNKVRGVRAALVCSRHQAVAARTDDDANVLVLNADETTEPDAAAVTQAWLDTVFSGAERHVRRLEKIRQLEAQSFK
jgi:ribose 5-phosphate isomerase B